VVTQRRSPVVTRIRRNVTLAVVVVVVASVLAACAPPPPPPLPPTAISRDLPVAETLQVFVDPTRPTPAYGDFGGWNDRWLFTKIWYPTTRANAPYPLVIFAPGYGAQPDDYAPLLSRIASAGYVVASPLYPILSGWPAGPSDVVDWDQKFPDTWFVTDSMIRLGESSDPVFGGLIDTQRIAVAGHSDGALISFGDGYGIDQNDPRVRAVISYAAQLGGAYLPNGRAFLHFLSDGDAYNDFGASVAWDDTVLGEPRWTVALWGADHAGPYMNPYDSHFDLVTNATISFLDQELKGASTFPLWAVVAWSPNLAAFV